MKLSNQEKIKMFEYAIDRFSKPIGRLTMGLCGCIRTYLREFHYPTVHESVLNNLTRTIMQEHFLKYKPEDRDISGFWFSRNEKRVEVLRKEIELLKPQEDYYVVLAEDYRTEKYFIPKGVALKLINGQYKLSYDGHIIYFDNNVIEENKTSLFKKVKKSTQTAIFELSYVGSRIYSTSDIEEFLKQGSNIKFQAKRLS